MGGSPLLAPPSRQLFSLGRRGRGAPRLCPTPPAAYTPVVPFTTNVVTAGLTAETVTGVTRRTPPMGTVRRMVPGWPGAPFSTTWDVRGKQPHITCGLARPCAGPPRPHGKTHVACCAPGLDPGVRRGPGTPHLGHSLLPVASGDFGNSSDDFGGGSSSGSHNLGGDNGDGGLDAGTAGHTWRRGGQPGFRLGHEGQRRPPTRACCRVPFLLGPLSSSYSCCPLIKTKKYQL